MTNEAVLVNKTDDPIDFIVSGAVGIEKGSLLELQSPRTAILVSAHDVVIAGIARREKIASDGRTRLAVFRKGIFRMIASGTVTIGDAVAAGETTNQVYTPLGTLKSGSIIGHALETKTDGQGVEIDVDVGSGSQAVS